MRNSIEHLLFDLDGTLTDPAEGITLSIQFALHRMGIAAPTQEELCAYIGPPIQTTFAGFLGTDDAEAIQTAVRLYRERYVEQGMYENRVYPGVSEMLSELNRAGKRLMVATSKPTVYARRILEHFALENRFTHIYGSELDGTRADKAELLSYILTAESLSSATTAMIGDRKHDMIGARRNGIYAVGVTYGYGSAEELTAAGADVLCKEAALIVPLFKG